MRDDLHLGHSTGFGGWLVSGFIAIAVIVWTFWILVAAAIAVVAVVAVVWASETIRRWWIGPERSLRRSKRRRLRSKPYRIYR